MNKSENDQSENKQDISVLFDRIDSKRTITIKDIQDTGECIKIFNEFKKLNDNSQIYLIMIMQNYICWYVHEDMIFSDQL